MTRHPMARPTAAQELHAKRYYGVPKSGQPTYHQCVDCPAQFVKRGPKVRCAACADAHMSKVKNARPRVRNRSKKVAP